MHGIDSVIVLVIEIVAIIIIATATTATTTVSSYRLHLQATFRPTWLAKL